MIGNILIDTGPLIALLDSDSNQHEWMLNVWKTVRAPAITCEPVLTEATFLLQRDKIEVDALYEFLSSGALKIRMQVKDHVQDIRALLGRYHNVPMSLADACLVRLSEMNPKHRLVTFDSDFHVYRKHGNRVISTLMPDGVR